MQAQMTPATAPGIAGLMQGKPQSPTAGLGNVPQRIGAYGEQGLAQKNAVTQDLLDLMAAQKLKAEKEAAARQMQLQAAQQGQRLTVAQSLDKELLDMTKQELAPQQAPQQAAPGVAQASQQQEQQKQAALQRLAQGIRNVPGSGNVVPPQGMAGGGIVAFQNRGEVPFPGYQDPDVDENGNPRSQSDRARIMRMNAALQARSKKYLSAPELYSDPVMTGETYRFLQNRLEEFPPTGPRGGPGFVREGDRAVLERPEQQAPIDQAAMDRVRAETERGPQFDIRQPPSPDLIAALQAQSQRVGPSERMGLEDQIAKMRQAMPPERAPAGGAGIRGLGAAPLKPQGVGQGITVPQGSALPQAMQQMPEQKPMTTQELLKQSGIDEESRAASAMERARAALGATPEEKAYFEERLARLQKREPDEPWWKRIGTLAAQLNQQKIQPGQQGIIGGLGRIATAGAQIGQAQKTAADQRQAQIDALRKEQMERARAERGDIFKLGEQARLGAREERLSTGKLGVDLAGQAAQDRRSAAELAGRTDIARQDRLMQESLTKLKLETQRDLAEDEARLRRELASIKETGGDQRAKTMQRYYESWEKLDPIQKADLAKQGIKTFNDYTRLRDAISTTPFGGAQSKPSAPAVGTVMQGYRFKGGDPSDRKNWEKV